jgi:hypothetical protein
MGELTHHDAVMWWVSFGRRQTHYGGQPEGVNSRFYQPGPYAPVATNLICWIDWHPGEVA